MRGRWAVEGSFAAKKGSIPAKSLKWEVWDSLSMVEVDLLVRGGE